MEEITYLPSLDIKRMKKSPRNTISTSNIEINEYYNYKSWEDVERLNCVVYELLEENKLAGFVTASMSKLRIKLDEKEELGYPALLLGYIGVDSEYKGKKYGKLLSDFVIGLANELKIQVGCRIVFLDVQKFYNEDNKNYEENSRLVNYYLRSGFEKSNVQSKKTITVLYYDLMWLDEN